MIYNTILPLFLSFWAFIFFTTHHYWIQTFAFSGWLAYTCLSCKFNRSLWISFSSGFIADLFCADLPLGFFASIFCLTTLIVKKYQTYFSKDKLSSLFLYVSLYSSINYMLCQCAFVFLLEKKTLSLIGMLSALFLCPLIDTLIFFTFVFYPILFIRKIFHPKNISLCKRKLHERKVALKRALQKLIQRVYERRNTTTS